MKALCLIGWIKKILSTTLKSFQFTHAEKHFLSNIDDKEDRRIPKNTNIKSDKDQISTRSNKIQMRTLFTCDTLFK